MQKLDLVDQRFPALLNGEKTDTIRWNEQRIELGFLVYESFPSKTQYAVVYVTEVLDIPLREVLRHTHDFTRTPDEDSLLSNMRVYYPDITLGTVIQFIKHLTPQQTRERFPEEVDNIVSRFPNSR